MPRKKWTAINDSSPTFLRTREKRKWQIALRRYVLERNPCFSYAPYFGLDIENLRKWFESQFIQGLGWESFGKSWQFEHIIPVSQFDFTNDNDLRLCWNFTNLRARRIESIKERGEGKDLLEARRYFQRLFETTRYEICSELLHKIETIESSESLEIGSRQDFIKNIKEYLDQIGNYSDYEFGLLNSGRNFDEVKKEIEFLKKF